MHRRTRRRVTPSATRIRPQAGAASEATFPRHRKANPIFYAYKDHNVLLALKELMNAAKHDAANPIWTITPFVDAPGDYGKRKYFFEWEREWRKIGHYEFTVDEVEFLVIPEALHDAARSFFENAKTENLGPCYECPFIDPYWPLKKIKP